MNKKLRIGVDMGGTNLRAALVNESGIVRKEAVPTPAKGSEEEVIEAIKTVIGKVLEPDVASIGIGVPSVLDREEGIVYNVANIPSWHEVPLKSILQRQYSIPVYINNDSNCFTLGESMYGCGRGYRNMVGVTLGTGLGAGIIIDGKLYSGRNTGAGEIGSLPYLDKDIEHYCSSSFFAEQLGTTAAELSRLARQGDRDALEGWKQLGFHLGKMVETVMFTYDPEAIVIGGGIARSFDLFEPSMRETIYEFPYPLSVKRLHLLQSTLSDAALLGAASLTE